MESTTTWLLTIGILSLVILFDLILAIVRRNKETTMTEAGIWTSMCLRRLFLESCFRAGLQIQMHKKSSLLAG
jgi:hypothetical protein